MADSKNALDRLKSLMDDTTDDDIMADDSISTDEYFEDVEAAILKKDETTSSQIQELTLDNVDDVSFGSNNDSDTNSEYGEQLDETDEETATEESETETPSVKHNALPEISINVTDTGDDSGNEELFNNNAEPVDPQPTRRGRGRRKKNVNADEPTSKPEAVAEKPVEAVVESTKNPLYDQLAHNLIDELQRKKYSFMGLNEDSMQILLNYIKNLL